jgi:hypothetical protein
MAGNKRQFEWEHRIGADECARTTKDFQNQSVENYALFPMFPTQGSDCSANKDITQFSSDNFMRFRDGYGPLNSCTVDKDSELRNGGLLTNDKFKRQLNSRVFQAVPDLSHGGFNPNIESRLTQGEKCSEHRSCNALSEVSINRFMPLVPCLRDTVQNHKHIVPTWTWGGEPTRDTVRQEEFLKASGYVFDGTAWQKKMEGCQVRK